MKIALGQINPTIGDFEGNRRLVLEAHWPRPRRAAPSWRSFPSWRSAGYPPKDLLERPAFVDGGARVARRAGGGAGAGRDDRGAGRVPRALPTRPTGRGLANSAALIDGGRVAHVVRKSLLPTYDVFDEWRYFEPATEVAPVAVPRAASWGSRSARTSGTTPTSGRAGSTAPIRSRRWCARGAEIILNLSASPYTMEKRHLRPRMLAATARRWRRPLLFVNQVGGQDDLVFDGASLALDAAGEVIARGAEHETDLIVVDVDARDAAAGELRAVRDLRRALGAGGAGARHARLRAPLRLLARAARAVGRHRLGAGRLHRGARPRPGERARRGHAVALLVAGLARRRAALAENLGIDFTVDLDRADVRRLPRDARAARSSAFAPAERARRPRRPPPI